MVKKITLTKEHLKLIPFIFVQEDDDYNIKIDNEHMFLTACKLALFSRKKGVGLRVAV